MRLRQGLKQSLTGKSKGCKNAAEEMSVSIIIEVYSVSVEVPTRQFEGEEKNFLTLLESTEFLFTQFFLRLNELTEIPRGRSRQKTEPTIIIQPGISGFTQHGVVFFSII